MALVEIKDFILALIDNSQFLIDQQKANKRRMKNLLKCNTNYDYAKGNLLDYLYHQNYYYKPIIN